MYNNNAFHQTNGLKSDASGAPVTQNNHQQIAVQPASGKSFAEFTSPNAVMIGCLTPFCIAFLAFSIHLVRHRIRLNRGLRRLQRITTLERTLEKTPDECS